MTEDDSPLVKRARGGDIDAFEELVERHRAVVFRVAARVVGPDSADDVSQDALLRAYHRLDSYRGEGSFRAWLLRIVHNTALNQLERRVPEPVGGSDEVEQAAPARAGGGSRRAGSRSASEPSVSSSSCESSGPSTAPCWCSAISRAWPTKRSPRSPTLPWEASRGACIARETS